MGKTSCGYDGYYDKLSYTYYNPAFPFFNRFS